jgi:Protein of unknown function (DUF2442)
MRDQPEFIQDSAPGVIPRAPWRVIEVQAFPDYRLAVKFIDGTAGEIDMSRLVTGDRAGIFAQLRDPELFNRAYVEYGAVVWPGEIDLAPDAMYDEIKKQGRWAPE